ncbi:MULTISPECIES: hypothetical protein [unclassified Endozoicomonas]|uniref:hypothetical protein n=1 Tax=unclassified Endozoicomonas TaxID=2644528 RepID=UPI003BB6EB8E
MVRSIDIYSKNGVKAQRIDKTGDNYELTVTYSVFAADGTFLKEFNTEAEAIAYIDSMFKPEPPAPKKPPSSDYSF